MPLSVFQNKVVLKIIKPAVIQSTTRITDFFVVGNMSGVLVGFVILVGTQIETRRRGKYRRQIRAKGFLFLNKSN